MSKQEFDSLYARMYQAGLVYEYSWMLCITKKTFEKAIIMQKRVIYVTLKIDVLAIF